MPNLTNREINHLGFSPLYFLKFTFVFMTLFLGLLIYSTPANAIEYAVGEGDLLEINVYEHPDLKTKVRVGADGSITFPLVGVVNIGGFTTSGVEKKLATLLEDGYIKKAHVTVFISEYTSKKVTVLGEFLKPGLIRLRGESTLLEVISSAGGLTNLAGDYLFIQRKSKKPSTPLTNLDKDLKSIADADDDVIRVELKVLLEKGEATVNHQVNDGDSIYIPKADLVYITGEVVRPGAYKITKGLTVLKAITLSGGFTPIAWKGRTKIVRKGTDGVEETIRVKMQELVIPEDVILVPESIF
ncbi:MAG: SLBB domain-containing protein [Deltaproteobacteria bacterium]|nr:SLBB domain-containing protein [Deltaproteobacteria bacterium]